MSKKKFDLSKIDWFHVCVFLLGLGAAASRTYYENTRFDKNLDKQYIDHFDERVSKIVDEKLKNRK